MPKVTFLPMNLVCDAKTGESLLDVAINHEVPVQHACGGFCACTTCHVLVISGEKSLSEMEDDEIERIERATDSKGNSRLGCQAKMGKEDVVVEVVNIDENY
jgi:2Fe-2S ferredoxin